MLNRLFATALCLSLVYPVAAIDEQAPSSQENEKATDKEKEPRVDETIVVTATRSKRRVDQVPVSMTILSGEEIQDSSGVGPDNIFKSVPGAFVRPSSATMIYPSENKASMRGIPGSSMLVMVDGIPVNDPHRGYIAWNKVVVDSIEQVEVVRGASSSLFGNYASGGAVNLITRPINQDRFDTRASYGTLDTSQLGIQLEKTVGETLSWGLNLGTFDTDGYLRPIPELRGSIDMPNWSKNRNLLTRIDYNPSPSLRTKIRGSYFNDRRSQGQPSSWNERTNYDLAFSGHQAIKADGDFGFTLFYQTQDFDGQNVSLSPGRDAETVANQQFIDVESLGGSLQWTRSPSVKIPLVSWGVDTLFVEAKEYQDSFLGAMEKTSTGGDQRVGGVFGQVGWRVSDATEVIVSSRVDYWKSFHGFVVDGAGMKTSYIEKESIEIDPRVSLRRQLSRRTAVRGSVYRAFNAPRLRDLYRVAAGRGRRAEPNPNLDPEIIVGAEVGFTLTGSQSRAEINLFHNEISDTLNAVNLALTPINIVQIQNIGKAESTGLELIGSASLSDSWSWTGSYSYTDTKITDNPSSLEFVGNQLTDIPEHQVLTSLKYHGQHGFTGELRGRYLAQIYLDAANQQALDSHTVFDLSSSIRINDRVQLFLVGSNLFDEEYVGEITIERRLGAPRQFFGGIRYSLPF